jgi:hypothetical protein
MPLKAIIRLSPQHFLQNFSLPEVSLEARIMHCTEQGLAINVGIAFDNPTPFKLSIQDISLIMTDDFDEQIGYLVVPGTTLNENDNGVINITTSLPYKVFDAEMLFLNITAPTQITIAGITKDISLTSSAQLFIPDIAEILHLTNKSLEVSLAAEFKMRLRGLLTNVKLGINNPTTIPLEAQNLMCSIYGVTGENEKLIVEQSMQSCSIGSQNEVCLSTNLSIPYLKLLFSGTNQFIPEWIRILITGDFSLQGTRQTLPLSVSAYIDPHIIS